jgi:puromycin-sensitive aminopeptidase
MLCCTEFAMGAMENWGLVTYREVDLMIDEQAASSQQKQRVAIVVAHELAHQWFGNLVTMDWWDDIWLNEGFACYMEHHCTNALLPEYGMWEQYTTDAMAAALRLDSLRSSHPIQVPMARAEEVEQVFDAISYCKGSTVVRMVAGVLGAEQFRAGLQLYMQRHQYGNTVTLDLWRAWQEVSGVDVPAMMASWTQQMGHPFLSVLSEAWSTDSVTLELEQNWFLADGSVAATPEEAAKLWAIPLLFASSTCDSDAVLMRGKTQSFTIPLDPTQGQGQDWVKLNAGQAALVRVAHSPGMLARLRPAITAKTLPPIDRAAVLLDTYALAKAGAGGVQVVQVAELLSAYQDEDNNTVWAALAGVLRALHTVLEEGATPHHTTRLDRLSLLVACCLACCFCVALLCPSPLLSLTTIHAHLLLTLLSLSLTVGGEPFRAFCALGSSMVKAALARVGWSARAEDAHTEKLLRATVIGLLPVFCGEDAEVLAEARRLYDLHWEDPAALSADFKVGGGS